MSASRNAIGGIDHIVIVVGDLARAAEIYRKLGFTLSPRGQHSAAMGTANHTLMLQNDYFELLTILQPTERNAAWQRTLAEGGGVGGVALQTEDPQGAFDYWTQAGFDPAGPIAFSRPVVRPDGAEMEARFETVSIAEVPQTGMRVFVCSQPTREAVWLPELTTHANTALAIRRLIVSAPDPHGAAEQWTTVIPHAGMAPTKDGVMLDLGSHRIEIVRPSVALSRYGASVPDDAPRGVGIVYGVKSPRACQLAIVEGGVEHKVEDGVIKVPPRAACNVYLGFERA